MSGGFPSQKASSAENVLWHHDHCLISTNLLLLSQARHAQEAGADAVACICPFYFKPPTLSKFSRHNHSDNYKKTGYDLGYHQCLRLSYQLTVAVVVITPITDWYCFCNSQTKHRKLESAQNSFNNSYSNIAIINPVWTTLYRHWTCLLTDNVLINVMCQ